MDAFVTLKPKTSKIFISDLKTRATSSMPRLINSRGTEMQLSLYHQLLSSMIHGTVDISRLCGGLQLNADAVFSDGFLAEAGQSFSEAGIISFDVMLANNTLRVL